MTYEVRLEIFEGPLDLLLHLIKKHEIDITDIPMALITEQYLVYLEQLKALNLDLAGEYLVLAATLIHIKSKMLLPAPLDGEGEEDEQADPRAELVRQLLEYQAYKEAAQKLSGRPVLERDVFVRNQPAFDAVDQPEESELLELSLFDLIDAFQQVLQRLGDQQTIAIDGETISLADRIQHILDRLSAAGRLTFGDLIDGCLSRKQVIYTLLALLELVKMKLIKAYQNVPYGVIWVQPAVTEDHEPA